MTPSKLPWDELIELARVEENNFSANQETLGAITIEFNELFVLQANLNTLIDTPALDLGVTPYIVITNCLQLINQDLLKGMVNLCRGYLTDAAFHVRRSIESAATLVEIVKTPAKADIWAAMETDDQIKNYVQNFMVFKLVKQNLSTDLSSIYENLCLSVHPSPLSIAHRTGFDYQNGWRVKFFDVESIDDHPRLKQDALNLLQTYRRMLEEIAMAFKNSDGFRYQEFQRASQQVHLSWETCAKKLLESGELSIKEFDDEHGLD